MFAEGGSHGNQSNGYRRDCRELSKFIDDWAIRPIVTLAVLSQMPQRPAHRHKGLRLLVEDVNVRESDSDSLRRSAIPM